MKKRLITSLLVFALVLAFKVSHAQSNYFYTSLKVPLFEYIGYVVSNNTTNKTDGILMDAGYGIRLNRSFAIETGIEYFIFNPYEKKYYLNSNAGSDEPIAEFYVENSAFGFQVRPVLKAPLDPDENTTLRFGCGMNYLKTFSAGYYYSNPDPQSSPAAQNRTEDHTETNFYLSVQPTLGVEFKLNDDWRLGFDFNYIKTNWSKSMRKLEFSAVPDLTVPEHKTSSIFIAGRIVFR